MAIDREEVQAWRRRRLADALDAFGDDKAALGRALGYRSGAYVRQMIAGERPITDKTVAKVEMLHGFRDWFAGSAELAPMISAAGVEVALIAELAKVPAGPEKTRLARQLLLQVSEMAARLQLAAQTQPAPAKRPRSGDPDAPPDTPPARP